jgi:hypothetical protein
LNPARRTAQPEHHLRRYAAGDTISPLDNDVSITAQQDSADDAA